MRIREEQGAYTDRFVAFVDILGFKELIKQSVEDEAIRKRIYDALQFISQVVNFNYHNFTKPCELGEHYMAFSDSLVISEVADTSEGGGLFWLLQALNEVTLGLLERGIFIRGGLTYGPLYQDKHICYGPAMVEAYQMEEHAALYPRIVIDKEAILEGIRYHCSANTPEWELKFLDSFIKNDTDGQSFLDFLTQWEDYEELHPGVKYDDFLVKVRTKIEEECSKQYPPDIEGKYGWLVSYYNDSIKRLYQNDSDIKKMLI